MLLMQLIIVTPPPIAGSSFSCLLACHLRDPGQLQHEAKPALRPTWFLPLLVAQLLPSVGGDGSETQPERLFPRSGGLRVCSCSARRWYSASPTPTRAGLEGSAESSGADTRDN